MKTRSCRTLLWATSLVLLASCGGPRWSLPTARPENVGLAPVQLARIAPALQAFVDSGRVGGIVAVIARHGQVGYAKTFGLMDIEDEQRMRHDAIFRIYSMTKPVLAVGAMILVEEGKLSLEDPVARYIPAFANVMVYAGGTSDSLQLKQPDSIMRVRHLLTHTAGLSYGIGDTPADSIITRAALYDASRTVEQFADSIAKMPLLFSPGTAYNYSPGLDVLGRVLEVASGQPLDRFLDEHIFDPLDMRDTGFRIDPETADRVVTLYARGDDGKLTEVTGGLLAMYEPDARFFWGGGGLLATPGDYLSLIQMLLNRGELHGTRVLAPESVAEITRNHLPPHITLRRGALGYGLAGSVLIDSTKLDVPGPNGIYRWSGYLGTYFWIDPVNDLVAMVWTQLNPGAAVPLEATFQRLVYPAILP